MNCFSLEYSFLNYFVAIVSLFLLYLVDGLRLSIVDFNETVKGSSTKEVMDLLLLTQYFDAIKEIGSSNNCKTTFIPGSSGITEDMRNSMIQAEAAQVTNIGPKLRASVRSPAGN